jgi:hypothetical protein
MIAGIVIYALAALMVVVLIGIFVKGSLSSYSGASGAGLTAFHDLQPSDKQRAVEVIIEEKAGTRKESQKSGEGDDGPLQWEERKQME